MDLRALGRASLSQTGSRPGKRPWPPQTGLRSPVLRRAGHFPVMGELMGAGAMDAALAGIWRLGQCGANASQRGNGAMRTRNLLIPAYLIFLSVAAR
jgi:hypothetical protein